MIDVKYGEIDVKNNGGWRKRRIYFSEIFTFSRMLRRCAHFPEKNCVAEQFLNFILFTDASYIIHMFALPDINATFDSEAVHETMQ